MSSTVKEGWNHVYPGTDYGYFEKGRVRGDDITVSLDRELDMEVNIRDGGDSVTAFIPIMEVIKPLLESHGYTVERKVKTVIINNILGNQKEVIHWEHESKLICGKSLDIKDDRYLINPKFSHRVNCPECIMELAKIGQKR